MKSLAELQKRVENLNDQIGDIFHATALNLEALAVQLQPFADSALVQGTLAQCQKDFEYVQDLFKQRGNLRLEYLITEQIKEEEAKVRRERLIEYEQKIYDQRRLISDKEAFYEALLKPRKRRPAHMTIQQFQAQRKQETIMEERRNLRRLQEETGELKQIQKVLKQDNRKMQYLLQKLESQDISAEQLQNLEKAIEKNPIIFDSISSFSNRRDDKDEIKRLLENISALESSNQQMHKQYLEERQLYQYLKWQHTKLKQQYLQKGDEKVLNAIKHRKKLQKIVNYKTKRSVSI